MVLRYMRQLSALLVASIAGLPLMQAQAAMVPLARTSEVSVERYTCTTSCYLGIQPSNTERESQQYQGLEDFTGIASLSAVFTAFQESSVELNAVSVSMSVLVPRPSSEFGIDTALSLFSLSFILR